MKVMGNDLAHVCNCHHKPLVYSSAAVPGSIFGGVNQQIDGLVSGFQDTGMLSQSGQGLSGVFGSLLGSVGQNPGQGLFGALSETLSGPFSGILGNLFGVASGSNPLQSVVELGSSLLGSFFGGGSSGLLDGITGGLGNMLGGLADKAGGLIGKAGSFISKLF